MVTLVRAIKEIIWILKVLNKEEMAFSFKESYIKIYNFLMFLTVNLKAKSTEICQLLTQGYNLLLDGPFDDFFIMGGLNSTDVSSA